MFYLQKLFKKKLDSISYNLLFKNFEILLKHLI